MKAEEFWIRLASSNRSDWVSRFELSNDAGDIYHVIEKSAADKLAVRVKGMILSLQKHGQNIDVNFHLDWLRKALVEYEGSND